MLAPNPQSPVPAPPESGLMLGGAATAKDAAPPMLHDVTIVRKRTKAHACVEGVPPEEFGISRYARSICDANYCYHEVRDKTQDDLIAQGFDEDCVKKLPTYSLPTDTEQQSRDTVDESTGASAQDLTNGARLILITEHYIRMDYEGDGKVALYRVTTGGNEDGSILTRGGKDDIERVDVMPFAAMTPVIVTHRFFGKSIADLVMDIQRIKTALVRAMLDNAYVANNRRTEVAESHASVNTLDDLLISRPNGIVRVKAPGGLRELEHTDISGNILPQLAYFDATREWRTGVSRQGQGLDAESLQNQSATAANQLYTAAQARMKLIARIFAETGIKDLFLLLHHIIRKHGQQAATVRLRNQWVTVDPRDWKQRDDMTINVGLGGGGKEQQLVALMAIIGAQEKAIMGGAPIVGMKNLYNSAKQLTKLSGFKDPGEFFIDPSAPPNPQDPTGAPIQKPPDPKQLEIQMKAEIEKVQAQADIATENSKAQAQAALAQQKFDFEKQLAIINAAMDQQKHQMEIQASQLQAAMKLSEHHQRMMEQSAKAQQTNVDVKHSSRDIAEPIAAVVSKLADHMTNLHTAAIDHASKPKRITGPSGKVYKIESA